MMLNLRRTTKYKKDYKLAKRQHKDLTKLDEVIFMLMREIPLPDKHRDHCLDFDYKGCRECHITNHNDDWLLIYKIAENDLVLERLGSHSHVFKD